MSSEKRRLHGGDKHGESENHNFEKKVVMTGNWCYKPGHWAKNYAMPFEEVLKIRAQQVNMMEDESDGDADYNYSIWVVKSLKNKWLS